LLTFVVRRLLLLIPILLGLSILVFLFVRALPGGPETALLGERSTPQRVAEVRAAYGLDRPVHEQYFTYMGKVAQLDFGTSIQTQQPVGGDRSAFQADRRAHGGRPHPVFAVADVGIPLGFAAGRRPQSIDRQPVQPVGSLDRPRDPRLRARVPAQVRVRDQDSAGSRHDRRQDVTITPAHPTGFYVLDGLMTGDVGAALDAAHHLVLPAIALGTIPLAFITRITRATVLEVSNEDYVRTAEAKGLTQGVISRRHVLRNALLPIVTVIGLQTGLLLSGAVLTERVFAFQGMGFLMAGSIFDRDFPVLQGGLLFLAVVFVLVNLFVDLLYGVLDPRVRVR
jgi:peptide/nickel transport system permease protein